MTREEEIDKIASAFAIDEVKDTCNPASKRGLLYVGFVTGAEWADAHPRWISVEDELPIDSNNVLCKNASGELYVDSYVRRTMYGDIWRQGEKHPTHWMPLPSVEHIEEK